MYAGAHLTLQDLELVGGEPLMSVNVWPVRCQTYGYLPSRKASPPVGWYQIILLGDRGTCVLTICWGLHSTAGRPGFELATCWLQVQRPNHSATVPLAGMKCTDRGTGEWTACLQSLRDIGVFKSGVLTTTPCLLSSRCVLDTKQYSLITAMLMRYINLHLLTYLLTLFAAGRRLRSGAWDHSQSLRGSDEVCSAVGDRQRHPQVRDVCTDAAAESRHRLQLQASRCRAQISPMST